MPFNLVLEFEQLPVLLELRPLEKPLAYSVRVVDPDQPVGLMIVLASRVLDLERIGHVVGVSSENSCQLSLVASHVFLALPVRRAPQ